MENITIGIVEIQFYQDGHIWQSSFTPKLSVDAGEDLLNKFNEVHVKPKMPDIKLLGEMTLAKFFSKVNEIELADREKYEITSKTLTCERYARGKVKRCVIEYSFTPLA